MEGQAQGPGGPDDSLDARGRLMKEVAEQMDAIEADHGSDFRIGRVVTVVEVVQPDGQTEVRVRAQMLPWVAWGMLDFAKKSLGG
jgi:hypothetical protein